jgi:hypothetical protein
MLVFCTQVLAAVACRQWLKVPMVASLGCRLACGLVWMALHAIVANAVDGFFPGNTSRSWPVRAQGAPID